MGAFTSTFNKALLPVRGKPTISYIVEYYPPNVEIVCALGYRGEQLRDFLEAAYPDRRFRFVTVANYDGPGSGPGSSLLACKEYLQCPFIYASVDTLVAEVIPDPDHNWFGVAEVADTARFCSVKTNKHELVVQIDDKVKTDNKYAFIGLAGIHDYVVFWRALERDDTLIAGERQVSNGFQALTTVGLKAAIFHWYDTGTPERYAESRDAYPH